MSKWSKTVLIALISVMYIVLAVLVVVNLPRIMSGGDPVVEEVLVTGRTSAKVQKEYDISTASFSIKAGDTIYLVQGVNGRVVFSQKNMDGANKAIVNDVVGNTAKMTVLVTSSDDARFRFGIVFFQMIVALIFILIPIFIAIKTRDSGLFSSFGGVSNKRRSSSKYGDQGSAKFDTIKSLRRFAGNDGFVISKHFRMSAATSYEHALILGPTGAGKSSSFFIPNLLDMDGSHSVFVTDPKGEACKTSRNYLESIGYKVIKIAPLDPAINEFKYNPVLLTSTDDDFRSLAQIILVNGGKSVEKMTGSSAGGAEWINMSIPLFAASLAYVKHYGESKSIPEAIDIILKHSLDDLEKMFQKNKFAYRQFLTFKTSAESPATLASIKSVLTSNVQIFLEDKIEKFVTPDIKYDAYGNTSIDESTLFSPTILREKPTALFLQVPENQGPTMMPLISVFYSQVLDACTNHPEGYPIFCFFDEFPNSGYLIGLDTLVSTCRSRRIGLAICSQGIEQIEQQYGKEITQTVLNNLKTKMFYAALSGDSGKYVSELAGYTTIESKNESRGGGRSIFDGKQVSKSGVRRELLTPDEVRCMDESKVLIIAQNANPVFDDKNSYFTQSSYMGKANMH